jgi:hypothetical protein
VEATFEPKRQPPSNQGFDTEQKKQLITRKPGYHHGQLLLEDDFIAEQQFPGCALPARAVPARLWRGARA